MILEKLVEYYERKAAEPDTALAPEGFEPKEIPFLVVLDAAGNFTQLRDTRTGDGKKRKGRVFTVPQDVGRSGLLITANLLWDTAEYALGITSRDNPRLEQQHADFVRRLDELPDILEIRAIKTFLAIRPAARFKEVPDWREIFETNPYVSFAILDGRGLPQPVFEISEVQAALSEPDPKDDVIQGLCLVTGETGEISRLHPAIKGVWGAQTSGAKIVSFNKSAFASFGKQQGENAPVGKKAAFAYTTALNHLLGKNSQQHFYLGKTSIVFWADKPCTLEDDFNCFFNEPEKDDPDRIKAIERLYQSVRHKGLSVDEGNARFFVLGLAPSDARIAIRFWQHGTVREISERIVQHFDDLEIAHAPNLPDYLPLWRLLRSIAVRQELKNIPPNLEGDAVRSILCGLPYPATLFAASIRRIRAEQQVTYERAAIIKAYLNRNTRLKNKNHSENKEEMKVALDTSNTNPGYLLGRLFAILERVQETANPGINATIRDRFYGAASSTPVAVFPNLLKLSSHHLSKIENANKGLQIYLERLISEIIDGLNGKEAGFPRVMSIEDQGRFAIGYYHQRQALFSPKEKKETTETATSGDAS